MNVMTSNVLKNMFIEKLINLMLNKLIHLIQCNDDELSFQQFFHVFFHVFFVDIY